MRPFREMYDLLLEAHGPCPKFGECPEALWSPASGLVPRGVLGATKDAISVRVIFVFAEPGDPQPGETYPDNSLAEVTVDQALNVAFSCFREGQDQFHRNTRWVMDQLFPGLSFEEQLELVWLTEGRLCSFSKELGGRKNSICASNYLKRQVDLLPNAVVIGFGGKAQSYLGKIGVPFVRAFALAPPGANQRRARPSWEEAIRHAKSSLSGIR